MDSVCLPEDLANLPSMFFFMASFCIFCNKGNKVGMITYAPKTNIAVTCWKAGTAITRIYFNMSENEKYRKGQKDLAGVSKYISKMKDAKLIKVKLGITQSYIDLKNHRCRTQNGELEFVTWQDHGRDLQWSGVAPPEIRYKCMHETFKLLWQFPALKRPNYVWSSKPRPCQQ